MGKRSHGLSKHPIYKRYNLIKAKCYNKNNYYYHNYGAIGVRMCDEWMNDFMLFYNWCLNNGWKPRLHIDKDIKAKELGIVPGLLYSPKWCSIVGHIENNNAKRDNRVIVFKGVAKNICQWAKLTGIDRTTIDKRITAGWSIEDALTIPTGMYYKIGRSPIPFYEYNGKKLKISEWAKEVGIDRVTLSSRLERGWDIEKTLTTPVMKGGKRK